MAAVLPQAASDFYRAQQRLVVATLALTRTAWARMDLADLDASWSQVGPVVLAVVTSAQLGSARNGTSYVAATLEELDQSVDPVAGVNAAAFSGIASDGRGLASLLEGAKIRAKVSQSLESGGAWLDMAAHTMVQDAARQAASVDMFTRPGVAYVRAVNPPCCQRCAVLANTYSAPTAFDRHPRCDCFAVPTTDPRSLTLTEPRPDQIKDLTKAQKRAIEDGADQNQVINSHRAGARSKDGMTTTEGTTRRGLASRRARELGPAEETSTNVGRRGAVKNYVVRRTQRLTPEAIYRVSATREEALQRLYANGYIR